MENIKVTILKKIKGSNRKAKIEYQNVLAMQLLHRLFERLVVGKVAARPQSRRRLERSRLAHLSSWNS